MGLVILQGVASIIPDYLSLGERIEGYVGYYVQFRWINSHNILGACTVNMYGDSAVFKQ